MLSKDTQAPAQGAHVASPHPGGGKSASPRALSCPAAALACAVPTPSTPWPRAPAHLMPLCYQDRPQVLFSNICPGKYEPKVLETSSCCCSMAGSCDLILFLIFFFFFFFMACTGWRNAQCQELHQSRDALVTKSAERTAAGAVLHHLHASAPAEMLRDVSPFPNRIFVTPLYAQLICKQS